jgi:diguanylate cyclase (GGDEF)-like protein
LRLVKPLAAVKKEAVAVVHRKAPAGVSDYYKRIERYAQQIRQTTGINEIINILDAALFETRALHSSDEVRAAWEQVQRAEQKIESLRNELEQLRELVHADPLTGAFNRGGLDDAFAREAARADRHDAPLCVALLDLDDFKRINDTCGHQTGDNALLHLVSVANETLRPADIIARFGGEEFVILLPNTGVDSAMSVIYRLQRNLTTSCFLHAGQPLPITFSAGVAARVPYEHQSTVISRADEALYEAKHTGKNRVVAAAL